MKPVIESHSLTRIFRVGDSEVYALRAVDLVVEQGEFLALMGPSGSGKSTLLHILGCLDRPTKGRYLLEGEDVNDLTDDQQADIRNRRIGFVFQNFNLLPRLSALENAGFPLLYRPNENDWQVKAAQALKRVGLGHRLNHRPNELSGGERQRVAIARALVCNPGLILADEPTGNLDSLRGQEIMELLLALVQGGITLVMVTHDAHCAGYANRVVTMQDGQIVSGGRDVAG